MPPQRLYCYPSTWTWPWLLSPCHENYFIIPYPIVMVSWEIYNKPQFDWFFFLLFIWFYTWNTICFNLILFYFLCSLLDLMLFWWSYFYTTFFIVFRIIIHVATIVTILSLLTNEYYLVCAKCSAQLPISVPSHRLDTLLKLDFFCHYMNDFYHLRDKIWMTKMHEVCNFILTNS